VGILDNAARIGAKLAIGVISDTPVTYTRTPESSYEPTDGEESVETPTTSTPKVSPPSPFESKYVDDSTVLQDDLTTLISALDLGFIPDPKTDTITFRSTVYRIVPPVKTISGGDEDAAYRLHLRP
jgi:hypothetical protein